MTVMYLCNQGCRLDPVLFWIQAIWWTPPGFLDVSLHLFASHDGGKVRTNPTRKIESILVQCWMMRNEGIKIWSALSAQMWFLCRFNSLDAFLLFSIANVVIRLIESQAGVWGWIWEHNIQCGLLYKWIRLKWKVTCRSHIDSDHLARIYDGWSHLIDAVYSCTTRGQGSLSWLQCNKQKCMFVFVCFNSLKLHLGAMLPPFPVFSDILLTWQVWNSEPDAPGG